MRFDDRLIEEIKSRLRLSEVIGRTVKLRRQGREYVGLSPFAKEKSPSFFVNDEKGFFHDFSSGKHGDLIAFLQETERLTFREAVERLAAEAGVTLPSPDAKSAAAEKKRQGLEHWAELAAAWFEGQLRRPAGEAARAYLERRGLPAVEWGRFRVGFAPAERTALKDYLVAKGAKPAELVDAGLLIAPEGGGAPYDRFRDRIIFPIGDARGRPVSFGGRAMDPAARAKYLNGPETALFHKGGLVYGLQEARKLLHVAGDRAQLVVVEGYMDVIACQRAEIPAVAPMGTALTEEQMELLWRQHPEPTLTFDGDAAGQRAADRAIDRALPLLKAGRSFRFCTLQGGQDPDDVLRDRGPAVLRDLVQATTPLAEALFERERRREALDTPERIAGLKVRLLQAADTIADREVASAYRAWLKDRWANALPGRRAPARPARASSDALAAAGALRSRISPRAAALAIAAMHHPEWLDDHLETVQLHAFGDRQLGKVAQWLVRRRLAGAEGDQVSALRAAGRADLLEELEAAAAKARIPFLAADAGEDPRKVWDEVLQALAQLDALELAIEEAKASPDGTAYAETIQRLKTERDRLRRELRARGC